MEKIIDAIVYIVLINVCLIVIYGAGADCKDAEDYVTCLSGGEE